MEKYIVLLMASFLSHPSLQAQMTETKFKGQDPIKGVSTENRAVARQWKGTFWNEDRTVSFSNDFAGGRLTGVTQVNDTLFECLIAPENLPVNPSPWYAFRVWSKTKRNISIRLTYLNGAKHRYVPKVSRDGLTWQTVKNGKVTKISNKPAYIFEIPVDSDSTWVAAQELETISHVDQWVGSLAAVSKIDTMGYSREGRPIKALKMGNLSSKNVIVVMGRQHPPEVTGHYALTAFVETLDDASELARKFRNDFLIYVIPMVNPDGVEEGFWRHNMGGIDLNRDWADFHQPESRAIRDYFKKELSAEHMLYFMIDFHSTYEDIYYTLAPDMKRNTAGLLDNWMNGIRKSMPGYDPRVKPLYLGPPTFTAYSYFYETYGAESVIFEIGDNTPRDFIKEKSRLSAESLMTLLERERSK